MCVEVGSLLSSEATHGMGAGRSDGGIWKTCVYATGCAGICHVNYICEVEKPM